LKDPRLELEYFEIAESDTLRKAFEFDPSKKYNAFIAAFAGPVRLIDNIALN
jgi:pantoate--beta-alanine ligase